MTQTRINSDKPRLLDRDTFASLVRSTRRNAGVFERLTYLDSSALRDASQQQLVITDSKDNIIAAASLQQSPHDEKRIWVLGVSVDEKHRGKGLGTTLLRGIFAHAAARKLVIETSSFSSDGLAYLAPAMARIHREFPAVEAATSTYPATLFNGRKPYHIDQRGRYVPDK